MKRKIMALDVGDKTIGVAVSDALLLTAQGITTIDRIGIRKDTAKVLELIKEHNCGTLIIGLPLNLDGTDSVQTENVKDFKLMMDNKLMSSGMKDVKTKFQDERFTTVMAEKVLIEADMSRKKRKKVIVIQGGVLILQSYLVSVG